jgi:hypothetical protein
MRFIMLVAVLAALTTAGVAGAHADSGPPWGPATPNFNLQVVLRPVAGGPSAAFGLVFFRQDINDGLKIVDLGTWVRDLAPNSSYQLQRAVDTNVDGDCVGISWLTLGQGLTTKTIDTDDRGTGSALLWRNLAAITVGSQFDIHFRVIDAVTKAVVLESGCYTYTVSQ